MNIHTAIRRAGSVSALARLLKCTRQAVQQFRTSGLPEARKVQLQELRPEWFQAPASAKSAKKVRL